MLIVHCSLQVIIYRKLPAIYLLPVELIERIIHFVAEISTAPNSRDDVLHAAEFRGHMFSLSRIERIGGNWMICAEKKLCERVILSKINSDGLESLAEMEVGDRRLHMIQEVYIYKVGDPEEYSESHHISKSDVINLAALLTFLPKLRYLYLALRFSDWQSICDILLEKQIELTTLWLYLCHDDDEDGEGPDDLGMDRISIAGIPSLVDLSVTPSNAAIILHPAFFDDTPLNNLQILNLEGSEEG